MLFSGRNIIVTGATGDLGAAITRRLIAQGANVLAVVLAVAYATGTTHAVDGGFTTA
jgi:NAD(P)-dependent dehydrogenase (short-subunit alcohol dehydrogenase family)